jgi:hypothetical protein
MGLSRLMETTAQNAKWRRMDPDTRAQATAAGLHAAVGVLRITPRASLDSLGEAFATGVRQHQETTIEGLRVSFSREPPSQQTVQARLERAVADLRHLGYRWTADAAPGSAEAGTNRMISAYIAQALTQLAHQQDLDQPFGNSWAELGGRVADQALNVEAHRQHAFQTVFSGLYAAGSAMSDLNLSGASATAAGNAVLAGILAMIYPLLYGGLLSRGAGHAQEEAAAAQADRRAEALRSLQQP